MIKLQGLSREQVREIARQIADSCGIRSLAFSSIGTGKKGFPKEKAAVTAVKTVTEYVREHPAAFDNISWILSDDETKQVYESALSMMEEVTRIKSQAKSPDLPVFRIGYKNRLVQVQMIKCLQEGHEVTPGNGIVTMLEKDGSRRMRAFNVGYCEQCQNHYILLSTAVSMKKQGVPMCRMLAKKDYEKEICNHSAYRNCCILYHFLCRKDYSYQHSKTGPSHRQNT